MKPYNQNAQQATWYSCSIYSFLHSILLDFGVRLELKNILTLNSLMKYLGYLLPKGAVADIIFPQLTKKIKKETGLDIGIRKRTIYNMKKDGSYILGFKYETQSFINFARDGKITRSELLAIKNKGKTGYHFIYWKKGYVVDSIGGCKYKLSIGDLKFALELDMFYPTTRTLYAKNRDTEYMQKKLMSLAKRKGYATKYENFINLL